MEDQIQKAVNCYEAGAIVLHLRVRARVPEMVIQVGGSISVAPEEGQAAKRLSDDTCHMLAELDPKPGGPAVSCTSLMQCEQ